LGVAEYTRKDKKHGLPSMIGRDEKLIFDFFNQGAHIEEYPNGNFRSLSREDKEVLI